MWRNGETLVLGKVDAKKGNGDKGDDDNQVVICFSSSDIQKNAETYLN